MAAALARPLLPPLPSPLATVALVKREAPRCSGTTPVVCVSLCKLASLLQTWLSVTASLLQTWLSLVVPSLIPSSPVPVALMEGKALVATLFGGKSTVPDYENVRARRECFHFTCYCVARTGVAGCDDHSCRQCCFCCRAGVAADVADAGAAAAAAGCCRRHPLLAAPPPRLLPPQIPSLQPPPAAATRRPPLCSATRQTLLPLPLPCRRRQVPTAVFCQPPLGTVGLTEEQAVEQLHGDIDVYISKFKPMKNTLR